MNRKLPRLLAQLLAALTLLAAGRAVAQDADCATLPDPVFVPGTSDVKPYLARVAPKLATAAAPDRQTIVYQSMGSCSAIEYVTGGADLTGTAVYWTGAANADGSPEEKSCTLPAGVKASVALSDVTVQTCTGAAVPAGIHTSSSYVQGFGFVVPPPSSQTAITAEEAYFLLKFGGEAGKQVPPWTDPARIVIRTPAASTQLLIGLAAGVPGTLWSGALTNVNTGSGDVVSKVAAEANSGNADQTLGILSLQKYDANRDKLRMLAFQAFDQACLGAVFPDSTPGATDKQNVRDGHYAIWGYLWSVAAAGGDGAPEDPAAAKLISFIEGTEVVNGADPILDAARVGAIPGCAMQVSRPFDGAELQPFDPPAPCGCAYEATVAGGTSCTACVADIDCPGGACRLGYCEVR